MEEPQGRPDLYQGLNMQYWMKKWLPDPRPDAVDELILVHLLDQAASLSDQSLQARIAGPIQEVWNERYGGKSRKG